MFTDILDKVQWTEIPKDKGERQQFSVHHEENPLHLGSIMSAANFFPPANFEVQVTSVFNSFFRLK